MIDFGILEDCMREHLNEIAPRRMAVLDPVKLVIENFPAGKEEVVEVPNHPQKPEMGKRQVPFSGELWIEREDYQETPAKGYFRLYPGNSVRLRYGYVVKCLGYDQAKDAVRCEYFADSKSGTAGAEKYKVKGNIHWVSVKHAHSSDVHLYDRLFNDAHAVGLEQLNPTSKRTISACLEPSLKEASIDAPMQFERHGYFAVDRSNASQFIRTVGLRDTWAAGKPA
jgi:glutaminyl-tRNA synthetase